ncbi:MAG TPA: hypothetical protein DCS93_38235, partial [Microscillaceae bacterium]|nr:hypothetical protein [Microscillaceae bacterium]
MKKPVTQLFLLWSILLVPFLGQAQWTKLNSGTTRDLRSIYFVDENVGYVGGVGIAAPTLLKTT